MPSVLLHRVVDVLTRESRNFCPKSLKPLAFFVYLSIPTFCEVLQPLRQDSVDLSLVK
jgi:hypothetical protein